jgi:PilZ domain-containing protein
MSDLDLDTDPYLVALAPEILRQRRGSGRRPLNAEIELLDPEGGRGVTINVSEGGLRVAIDCLLSVDQVCLVRVLEPGVHRDLCRVRVVWVRELRDGCVAGLQMLGLH